MFFKIIVERFSASVASSLSVECNVFETDKKNPSVFIVGRGDSVKCFPPWRVMFDRFQHLCQAERRDFSSLPNTKSRHVSAIAACSLWSCISSVVKLNVCLCLHCCTGHWDAWTVISCVEVFIVWNPIFNHSSCIAHFLDPEFCCCCRMLSFSICQLWL